MKMKQVLKTMVLAAFCLSGMAFIACNNDDDYDNSVYYPNALVTIKTNTATGQVYLQLDDATTVLPTNMKTSRYGNRELRALANLTMQEGQPGHYSKTAFVNWMDTILTKKMSPDLGAKNDKPMAPIRWKSSSIGPQLWKMATSPCALEPILATEPSM